MHNPRERQTSKSGPCENTKKESLQGTEMFTEEFKLFFLTQAFLHPPQLAAINLRRKKLR